MLINFWVWFVHWRFCYWWTCRFCRHADENKRQKVALILDKLITMTIDEVEVRNPNSDVQLIFTFVWFMHWMVGELNAMRILISPTVQCKYAFELNTGIPLLKASWLNQHNVRIEATILTAWIHTTRIYFCYILLEVVLMRDVCWTVDVPVDTSEDMGQHRPSIWPPWHGSWQLHQGINIFV